MWWSRGTWPEGTAAWGESMLQDFPEGLQHMGKAHTGKLLGRRRVELLWTDHNHPHATWNMEEVEEGNEGVKQLWKKGLRSRCFRFCLCVSPFSSILIGNKFSYFSQNPIGARQLLLSHLPGFISNLNPLILFPPPILLRRGREQLGGCLAGGQGPLCHMDTLSSHKSAGQAEGSFLDQKEDLPKATRYQAPESLKAIVVQLEVL